MNELTIEFANKPNPVENYIGQVIADAENGFASYTWEVIPDLSGAEHGLYFSNTQNHLHATLIRRSGEDFILYSLTVRREDGEIEFTSTDLDFEQEDSTSLGQLYCAVQAAIAKAAWEKANVTIADPKLEPVEFVDQFIAALLRDARGPSHRLSYERKEDGQFVVSDFGESNSNIILSKDWESETADQYTIKLVLLDGTEVISCTDRCKITPDEEELRELYRMVAQQYTSTMRDIARLDIQCFIKETLIKE